MNDPRPENIPDVRQILLAEDNAADVTLVREALKAHGVPCTLRVVKDGAEAIAYLELLDRDHRKTPLDLLLLRPVRPLRGKVIRRQLNAEPPLTVDQHAVPVVLPDDHTAQHPCPEGALGRQIGRVEYDDLSPDLHPVILCERWNRW